MKIQFIGINNPSIDIPEVLEGFRLLFVDKNNNYLYPYCKSDEYESLLNYMCSIIEPFAYIVNDYSRSVLLIYDDEWNTTKNLADKSLIQNCAWKNNELIML